VSVGEIDVAKKRSRRKRVRKVKVPKWVALLGKKILKGERDAVRRRSGGHRNGAH
jgi:hypothetical protein